MRNQYKFIKAIRPYLRLDCFFNMLFIEGCLEFSEYSIKMIDKNVFAMLQFNIG